MTPSECLEKHEKTAWAAKAAIDNYEKAYRIIEGELSFWYGDQRKASTFATLAILGDPQVKRRIKDAFTWAKVEDRHIAEAVCEIVAEWEA